MENMHIFSKVFPHFEDEKISGLQKLLRIKVKSIQGINNSFHFFRQAGRMDSQLNRKFLGHWTLTFIGKVSNLPSPKKRNPRHGKILVPLLSPAGMGKRLFRLRGQR